MTLLSIKSRKRIVSLHFCGFSVPSIVQQLKQEEVAVSQRAVYNLVEKFRLKGVVKDLPSCKKDSILTEEMKMFMEEELTKNDELTSTAIKASMIQKWPDLRVSTSTIKRVRYKMGWVCNRPHYCQLLREVNMCICCYKSILIFIVKYVMLFLCNIKINAVFYTHARFKI